MHNSDQIIDAASQKITAVRGMNDLLPEESFWWFFFENTVKNVFDAYGYQNIRTPIVESAALFTRSIGASTDIVTKEMYCFVDALNGALLTLRPENTAAVVRAALEHHLLYDGPKRLWYMGPMFRHERPQRGRYRQFHQVGVEALGFAGAEIEAELILIVQRIWQKLGLRDIQLEINCLGQVCERAQHRNALLHYFETSALFTALNQTIQQRLLKNPLRIFDSKNQMVQEIAEHAPVLAAYLSEDSRQHFEELKKCLAQNQVSYRLNPKLVRGLDYYNLSVFEWVSTQLGAQNAVAGGGRYDGLIEQLGGKPAPACGWAIGIERVLELLKIQSQHSPHNQKHCDVYLVHQGHYQEQSAANKARTLAEYLRDEGFNVILHQSADGRESSFKTQMKAAHLSAAEVAVIIGEKELSKRAVSIKALRNTLSSTQNESHHPADSSTSTHEERQVMIAQDHLVSHLLIHFAH